MADQALEILIKLLSDTKGAEAVQAALDKTRASAEDITTHLPEGAEAWQKYKGVLNQTAQESGNLKAAQEVLSSVVQKLKLPLHELTPLLKDFADPCQTRNRRARTRLGDLEQTGGRRVQRQWPGCNSRTSPRRLLI